MSKVVPDWFITSEDGYQLILYITIDRNTMNISNFMHGGGRCIEREHYN